ncbi:MAG: carbon-nitrogen hydrolase family protein [Pirellulaceae bacterium]|nr:carbon-nitrogen hydrolase family protein [Pirellulaceae bacterium]
MKTSVFLLGSLVCGLASPSLAQTPHQGSVKVAAAQILTDTHDLQRNRCKIMDSIRQAKSRACDIVLFHEGCLTGYPNREQLKSLDFALVRQAELEIRDLAKELNIAVLLGSTGQQDDQFLNYVLVIDEHGRLLGHYDKTWRAGEPHYCAGRGPVVFTIAGVEATVIICHDLRYPELVRLSVAAGARIVFIANNESGITSENKLLGYRSMQISRATENLVYAVMSNSPADPHNIERHNCSHGNSLIVDPLGNVLDEAGVFEERLVIAELALADASASTVTRTLGKNEDLQKLYGIACENEAYAAWMQSGLSLVQRLDGSDIPVHFLQSQ